MDQPVDLSVIVVNWNRRDLLALCLTALQAQSYPRSEIILVDNGSTDGSVAYVREHFPQVKVIALPENRGFAGGNNVGIRAASGKYIALLNNDAQPESHWLEALVHALETHPEVGFCASKMLRADDPQLIDTAGDVFYDYGVGGKRGMDQLDGDGFFRREYVFGACAGAAIYRRAMLQDVGLFDEDFFLYMEDIDLSFRAQLRGYKCLFVPEAQVYHQVAASAGWGSHLSIYYTRRNILYVLVKDLPTSLLLHHLGPILFYFLASDLIFAVSGYAGATARARRDNLKMLKKMLAKRRRIQSTRRVSDAYVDSILTKGQLGSRVRTVLTRLVHGQHLSGFRKTSPHG
ncbi:MAG: glycosyltransferase family 2 protein [Chloroflexota bacterium]|nr:glycosyltransferase family 2 protein [Chloroflexota bacterium]